MLQGNRYPFSRKCRWEIVAGEGASLPRIENIFPLISQMYAEWFCGNQRFCGTPLAKIKYPSQN